MGQKYAASFKLVTVQQCGLTSESVPYFFQNVSTSCQYHVQVVAKSSPEPATEDWVESLLILFGRGQHRGPVRDMLSKFTTTCSVPLSWKGVLDGDRHKDENEDMKSRKIRHLWRPGKM